MATKKLPSKNILKRGPFFIYPIGIIIIAIVVMKILPKEIPFLSNYLWQRIAPSVVFVIFGLIGLVIWFREELPIGIGTLRGKYIKNFGLLMFLIVLLISVFRIFV